MNAELDWSVKRDRLFTRLVDWVFGFNFFLSYNHGDGLYFPNSLKRRLEQAGFRVFPDQSDYVAGLISGVKRAGRSAEVVR